MDHIKGIVSSIKQMHNPFDNTYNIIADKVFQEKSKVQFELFDEVEIHDGTAEKLSSLSKEKYDTVIEEFVVRSEIESNIQEINSSLKGNQYEKTAKKVMPDLASAAKILVKAYLSGAPIVVRFHNDGDGASGAIALHRSFQELQKKFFSKDRNVSWQMNKGIAYTIESFYTDKMLFDSYKSAEKPILVIMDFGTAPESVDAIKNAQSVCNIIWLDHHMPYDKFPKELISNYINIFDYEGDSNFTAGLLACIFAQVISKVAVEDLIGASLISDFSTYANFDDKKAIKNSMILDYMTSTSNDKYGKPKQMDLVILDKEKSEALATQAGMLLEESLKVGMQNIKNYKGSNDISIHILDFGHVAKLRFEYPLPGRFTSKLQNHLETLNNGKTITIVHYGNYISLRASRDILDTVNFLDVIEKIKTSMGKSVSGGGHKQAASIRADKDNTNQILDMLLLELGAGGQC